MSAGAPGSEKPKTEQKLERLLEAAALLMARQGFSQTTIRDVARESGFSLAGMYYYFTSKEDLLYQIQHRTFSRLLAEQEEQVAGAIMPAARLEALIRHHLLFFTRHAAELKVCTFELESLNGEPYQAIERLRKRYYRLVAGIVAETLGIDARDAMSHPSVRHLTLFIFGMLNWVFMWYQDDRDVSAEDLAGEMSHFVLSGIEARRRELEGR